MSSVLLREVARLKIENRRLKRANRWLIESRDYWRTAAGSRRKGRRS